MTESGLLSMKPLRSGFGVEVLNIDVSEYIQPEMSDALNAALDEFSLLYFRDQKLTSSQQVAFTRRFGPPQDPIGMNFMIPAVEDKLCDSVRGLRARVVGLSLCWSHNGADLIADRIEIRGASGEVVAAAENVKLGPQQGGEEAHPQVSLLQNRPGMPGARNDVWHCDLSFAEKPPRAGVLYAEAVPSGGKGDTLFCDMRAAYDKLSADFKDRVGQLRAVHRADAYSQRHPHGDVFGRTVNYVPEPISHPLVTTNSRTNRKNIFLNPYYTAEIESVDSIESEEILDRIWEGAIIPDHIYRHSWSIGDLIIWDNCATIHYAVHDYDETMIRVLRRTTAAGEKSL